MKRENGKMEKENGKLKKGEKLKKGKLKKNLDFNNLIVFL